MYDMYMYSEKIYMCERETHGERERRERERQIEN